jgi:ribosome-associated protein
LYDLLKVMGWCDSGGLAKIAIATGSVKVDGCVELRKRCKMRTGLVIEFNNRKVKIT